MPKRIREHTSQDEKSQERPSHTSASDASLRYGAPPSVVDPLVSFLFDLHRLQQSVLSSLAAVGVDLNELPAPFGSHSPRTEKPAPVVAAPCSADPIAAYLSEGAAPGSCITSSSSSGSGRGCAPSEVTESVEALLRWVDSVSPPSEASSPPPTAASRRMLAQLVAAETQTGSPPRVLEGTMGVNPPPSSGTMQYAGSFDMSDVKCWRHYEDRLGQIVTEMRSVLRALRSPTVSGSLSCHAKWLEKTATSSGRQELRIPSCDATIRNFEEMIVLRDALATCQVQVRESFLNLEQKMDTYADEASLVCEREHQCGRNIARMACEYRALKEMKRRIKKLRATLPAEGEV